MVNLLELRNGGRFEAFCKALLIEQYPRFQAFSAPDSGVDGYDDLNDTVFQFYFPEGAPRKDKIVADIRKVLASGTLPKAWILILPKDPTPLQTGWVNAEFAGTQVTTAIWGKTEIEKLLRRHARVQAEFFPTEVRKVIQRLAKGKKPCFLVTLKTGRQSLLMRVMNFGSSSASWAMRARQESAGSPRAQTTAASMANSTATFTSLRMTGLREMIWVAPVDT